MNRRQAIATGIGATVGVLASGHASAQPKKEPPKKEPPKVDARAALISSLQTCLTKAQLCEEHCAAQLAAGGKDFARCAATVADTLAVGWATQSLVARKSAAAKKLVETFSAICKECSAACLEHKAHWAHGMHLECKECMDACDACIKACAAYLAS